MTTQLGRPPRFWKKHNLLLVLGLLALVGVLLLSAVGLLLNRGSSSTVDESISASPSQPKLLPSPAHSSGDGWELDVYVSNLEELDLALVAGFKLEGSNRLQLALVDIPSGQTVASGLFGTAPHVRLREDPLQLLVSDLRTDGAGYRLLIFDLDGQNASLAATLELPERISYHGFANAMVLSGDERYLFVRQITRINKDEPACPHNADLCTRSNIGVIDLNQPTEVTPLILPVSCGSMTLSPFGDQDLMVTCGIHAYALSADGSISDSLTNDARRALRADGAVLVEPVGVLGAALLPKDHQIFHVEKIDDSRVLALAGPRGGGGQITELLVVDIEEPRVEYSIDAPSGFVSAAPIDDSRVVLLIHDTAGELPSGEPAAGDVFAIRELDLTSGQLGESIVLRGLPGEPVVIHSPTS